ncbi:MAG: pseudouridine synthase [Pseudomonadota bacterium]
MPSKLPPRKDKNRVPRTKRVIAPVHKDAERVAKVIARAGLGSRREIEDWIEAGRVAVNGTVLQSPAVTVTAHDRIEVDGAPLPEKERTRLFLYHKPRGVVTTNRDPEGRTTLFEILPKGLPRLVSVGRLDLNSEGLLLLTNDGGLARVLELPETGWLRRYRVRAKGEIDQAKLDALMKGITVDGITYGPIEATLDRVQGANAWLTVSLREGKNREVRNVLAALGMAVNRLIRTSYGPFQLGDTPEGGVEEVRTRILRDQIGAELVAASGADFEGPLVEHEIEPVPQRPMPDAPRARTPRRAEREPEARGRSRHPEGVEEDVVSFRMRSRKAAQEEREVESRGSVADRKGREIQVERVVSRREEEPPARGRHSGREDGPRRDRRGGDSYGERPRGPRPEGRDRDGGGFRPARSGEKSYKERSRGEGADGARGGREDFRRGDERPARRMGKGPGKGPGSRGPDTRGARDGYRSESQGGDRWDDTRARPARDDRPRREGPSENRPYGKGRPAAGGGRPFRPWEGDYVGFVGGPARPGRDRPRDDRPRDDRPRGDRPRGDRPYGDRPREDRPRGDRPRYDRPRDERPRDERPRDERPRGDRPYGDRPRGDRPREDRPRQDRPRSDRPRDDRPREDRPRYDRPRDDRPRDDKPWAQERGGGERSFGGQRPAGKPGAGAKRFGPSKGGKPGGKPAGRPGGKPGGFSGGKSSGGRPSGGKPGGRPSGPPRKRG